MKRAIAFPDNSAKTSPQSVPEDILLEIFSQFFWGITHKKSSGVLPLRDMITCGLQDCEPLSFLVAKLCELARRITRTKCSAGSGRSRATDT